MSSTTRSNRRRSSAVILNLAAIQAASSDAIGTGASDALRASRSRDAMRREAQKRALEIDETDAEVQEGNGKGFDGVLQPDSVSYSGSAARDRKGSANWRQGNGLIQKSMESGESKFDSDRYTGIKVGDAREPALLEPGSGGGGTMDSDAYSQKPPKRQQPTAGNSSTALGRDYGSGKRNSGSRGHRDEASPVSPPGLLEKDGGQVGSRRGNGLDLYGGASNSGSVSSRDYSVQKNHMSNSREDQGRRHRDDGEFEGSSFKNKSGMLGGVRSRDKASSGKNDGRNSHGGQHHGGGVGSQRYNVDGSGSGLGSGGDERGREYDDRHHSRHRGEVEIRRAGEEKRYVGGRLDSWSSERSHGWRDGVEGGGSGGRTMRAYRERKEDQSVRVSGHGRPARREDSSQGRDGYNRDFASHQGSSSASRHNAGGSASQIGSVGNGRSPVARQQVPHGAGGGGGGTGGHVRVAAELAWADVKEQSVSRMLRPPSYEPAPDSALEGRPSPASAVYGGARTHYRDRREEDRRWAANTDDGYSGRGRWEGGRAGGSSGRRETEARSFPSAPWGEGGSKGSDPSARSRRPSPSAAARAGGANVGSGPVPRGGMRAATGARGGDWQ